MKDAKPGSIAEMLAKAGGQSPSASKASTPTAESSEAASPAEVSNAKPGSIAEMLAKAGGKSSSGSSTPPSTAEPAKATMSSPVSDAKPGSIAEMLAKAGGQNPGSSGGSAKAAQPETGTESSAGSNAKPGSIAAMMAAARGESQSSSKTQAQPAAKSKPTPEKKSAAKKKAAAPAAPTERMDTASVLAGARGDAKRGPVSKSEAPELMQRKRPVSSGSPKVELPEMPKRPAYVKAAAKAGKDKKVEERRQFVFLSALFGSSFATGMTALTTTAVVWTLALARYLFPNVLTEPPSQFKVGFPDDFAPGQVETKFKAQFGIWLVSADYQGEPCIFALSTVCTHLGCTPNWLDSEQKFKCPCHGSGFYKDGINFEGPAPRPLERYAIRVASDGQLEVDKSRKFQEEMGQWQDPASFVAV